ncbi:four-helix bundle copper-binding protein [Methylocystis heyeri]|uniref:Csp1 family four helix bundle copper storage protein n=1 Tax=Methylocystis heyeri TaxID=391905 RepID=A0A6B8KHH4_9HYPH|nr:four-helix bundle copper-binding protein [Methylocystis heyeri]QGM45920.1 Csp1 family four helix bundle copper storage protein [Methylocystis heyeri]
MQRREFIASVGTVAAFAAASRAYAQTAGAGAPEEMHPPKFKALEQTSIECVATGNDCLRHCFGMFSMKDTSMAECADAAFQLVSACNALAALASVNSSHTQALARTVAQVCDDCKTQCDKFSRIAACVACGDACKKCADECRKA